MQPTLLEKPSPKIIQNLIQKAKIYLAMGDYFLQFDSEQTFAVTLTQNSKILAGAAGVVALDWAYLDTVWVDDSLRGQGMGRQLMLAVESYISQLNLNGIYLYTADFQAPRFYPKLGYEVLGHLPNRPRGQSSTYFYKTNLSTYLALESYDVENPIVRSTYKRLEDGLDEHAEGQAPIEVFERVWLIQDEDKTIQGGIFAHEFWGWLDVHLAYATSDDELDLLLETMESFCQQRNVGIFLMSYDPSNNNRLRQRSYQEFAILPERPTGQSTMLWTKDA